MPGIMGTSAVKDGNNTLIAGGVQLFDLSGSGAGSWVPVGLIAKLDGTAFDPTMLATGGGKSLLDVVNALNAGVLPSTNNTIKVAERIFNVDFATLTRPANITPYTALDSVSDNATAASVSALVASLSDANDAPVYITSVLLRSTDTGPGTAGIAFRAYLFNSDPTANTGVQAGDNTAYSQKQAGYVGSLSGVFRPFFDGSVARLVPDEGSFVEALPASGTENFWIQYQTLGAFTPSANSTAFIGKAKGFQGRA